MEKKNRTGLFVVIGVLVFLLFVLVVLVGVLIWKGLSDLDTEQLTSQYSSELETILGDVQEKKDRMDSDNSVGERENSSDGFESFSSEMKYVVGGYEFTVPAEYDMFYSDTTGTVVYQDDVFLMKTAVVDTSYEEVMKNPESLTQASVDVGGTILKDIAETELNGKKYAYYRADLSGDECLVVYTQAPDSSKRIAGQIVLEDKGVSDEEMLQMFSLIAESAVGTDKPDSTYDDIAEQNSMKTRSESHGEMKEESTLKFGDCELTHKVPEGFYSEEGFEGSEYIAERFYTVEPRVDVTCYLYDAEWFAGAQGYVENSKLLDNTRIETMEVEGKTIYYVVEKSMNENKEVQQIVAGFDLGDNRFYAIVAYVSDEDIDLSMETVREFLVVKE